MEKLFGGRESVFCQNKTLNAVCLVQNTAVFGWKLTLVKKNVSTYNILRKTSHIFNTALQFNRFSTMIMLDFILSSYLNSRIRAVGHTHSTCSNDAKNTTKNAKDQANHLARPSHTHHPCAGSHKSPRLRQNYSAHPNATDFMQIG